MRVEAPFRSAHSTTVFVSPRTNKEPVSGETFPELEITRINIENLFTIIFSDPPLHVAKGLFDFTLVQTRLFNTVSEIIAKLTGQSSTKINGAIPLLRRNGKVPLPRIKPTENP